MAGDAKAGYSHSPSHLQYHADFDWDNPNSTSIWQMTGNMASHYLNFVNQTMSPAMLAPCAAGSGLIIVNS
jgi:hypothetical protein